MKAPFITFIIFSLIIVLLTGFWHPISTSILPNTTWGLYCREFFEQILSSAHGLMIDLFLVGVLLLWFERRAVERQAKALKNSEYRARITRYREELSELALYAKNEIAAKTLAKLELLMSNNIFDINCPEMRLEHLAIKRLRFERANLPGAKLEQAVVKYFEVEDTAMQGANCIKARLRNAKFTRVNIARVNFEGASLSGATLADCNAERANFSHANLRSAIFRGTNCEKANFDGADVRSANFVGARNFTKAMLIRAKNAKYAKL